MTSKFVYQLKLKPLRMPGWNSASENENRGANEES